MATAEEFRSRKARVGVVGLGYVGVPLGVEFANGGYSVLGFDNVASKVKRLNAGEDIILDVEPGSVARLRKAKRLEATTDFRRIRECDAVIICVPTPLDEHKEPDLTPVRSATQSIAPYIKKGQVIVLESTTYPGTTREVLKPLLEAKGLKAGRDFHLGFSPERVDPGNEKFKTKNTPKIISGLTPRCLALIQALYSGVIDRVVSVSTPEAAEMAKLLENIFRNVNIALVNELMLLSDRMGINIWEVIDAAATKPFGFMPFYPGPGVGGHCIPIDPFYLSWKAKEVDFFTNFITLSAEVNENIPYYVVEKLAREVNLRLGRPLKGLTVLVAGVAFKKNVDDARNTPAEKIIRRLMEFGAKVVYHDPWIPEFRIGEKTLRSVSLTSAAAKRAQVLLIHTNHTNVDLRPHLKRFKLVIDCQNATKNLGRRRNVVKI
jgi:UDP-N-acetyl-D-glucosamine dehydrogenase